jgi:hypothetical protein
LIIRREDGANAAAQATHRAVAVHFAVAGIHVAEVSTCYQQPHQAGQIRPSFSLPLDSASPSTAIESNRKTARSFFDHLGKSAFLVTARSYRRRFHQGAGTGRRTAQ